MCVFFPIQEKKKKKKSLSQGLMFHFPIDLDAGITRDPGEHLKAN